MFLCASLCRGELVSFAHPADIHSSFASPHWDLATNMWNFVVSHTQLSNDVFGARCGRITGTILTGDCYEDNTDISTNVFSDGRYPGIAFTNDIRRITNAGQMLFITDGNHDNDNTNGVAGWVHSSNILSPFSAVYPASLFTNQSYYVSNKAGTFNNMVMKMDVGPAKLGFVSMHSEFQTNVDQATLYAPQVEWVRSVMRSDPTRNWIVCAHYFLGKNGNDTNAVCPSYEDHNVNSYANIGPGRALIDNNLLSEPNWLGCLSGHNIRLYKGVYQTNGWDGHQVFFCQFDTQSSGDNPNRFNVMTIDTGAATIFSSTFVVSDNRFVPDYETTNQYSINSFFSGGFRNNLTNSLAAKPPTQRMMR